MLSLKRRLYRLILHLHPAVFRSRFAREMSLDFEDALATYGFSRLLLDATRSLIRQWITAPTLSPRSAAEAPISLHPLLAGHYVEISDKSLTPVELLRGSLLFVLLFSCLAFMLSHGGKYIHTGRDAGSGLSIGSSSHSASTLQANANASEPDYSQNLVVPTSSLPRYGTSARDAHTLYVNPAAADTGRQTESWKEFLLRCAIISAIVWLTSLLVRRARSATARFVFVATGLFMVAIAALIPFHLADTTAQAELLHPNNSRYHFESATIRLRQMAADYAAPESLDIVLARFGTVAPGTGSAPANLVHINSSIRTLLAQSCNMPPGSIVGGPGWLDTDSYDITARIDPATSADMQKQSPWLQRSQVRLMVQQLVVDRLHLKLHVESRPPDVSTRATTESAPTPIKPIQVLVIDHIDRPSEN